MQKTGSVFASRKAVPVRVLVTGFGSFPGVRDNPTAALMHALAAHRARLARLGIALERAVLPVTYVGAARKLAELIETLKPDAIVHFGLAARRKCFSIETRALNRLSSLRCDASGAHAPHRPVVPGAPQAAARSTFPAPQIEAALRRAGLRVRLSINAGNYICNETLYLTLIAQHAHVAGFIHVPRLARAGRPKGVRNRRPDRAGLTRAALIAILITARKCRQNLARHDVLERPPEGGR